MIKYLSLALVISVSTACASNVVKAPEDVMPFVNNYLADKNKHTGIAHVNRPIEIVFDHLEGQYVGWCKVENGKGHIILDKSTWSFKTESWKRELVYHELGHCDLLYGHVHGTMMHPNIIGFLSEEFEAQVKKFFNHKFMIKNQMLGNGLSNLVED